MATQTMTRIGTFTWSPGGTFQDPDALESFAAECAGGCGHPVTEQSRYRYCDQNGEVCHTGCTLPIWE
jgi:hypothetical protein